MCGRFLQRALALSSAYMLQPGDAFPTEGTPLTKPSAPSLVLPPAAGPKHGLSSGVIAGISVGAVFILILGVLLFFFTGRSRSLKEEMVRKSSTIRRISLTPPSGGFYPQGPAYFSPQKLDQGIDLGADVGRTESHGSVGGAFMLSPTTEYFTGTHEGIDAYKYAALMGAHTGAYSNTHAHHPVTSVLYFIAPCSFVGK